MGEGKGYGDMERELDVKTADVQPADCLSELCLAHSGHASLSTHALLS